MTFDHLTWKSIGIIYSLRGNYCSQSSNYQTNMYKEIEQKTLWTLTMKSTLSFWWNECEILWRHPLYQVKYLSSKGRINYWVDNILDEDIKFGLEFDHMTWKLVRNIYFLWVTFVPKLVTINPMGHKILSWQHLG